VEGRTLGPLRLWPSSLWLGHGRRLLLWGAFMLLHRCCLLLQYLIQSCARGGRRTLEDMRYEIRRAEACVD